MLQWRSFESQSRALGKRLLGYLTPCPVRRSVIGDVVCSAGRAPPLGWIRLSYPPDKLLVSSLNSSAFSLSLSLPLTHAPSLPQTRAKRGWGAGGRGSSLDRYCASVLGGREGEESTGAPSLLHRLQVALRSCPSCPPPPFPPVLWHLPDHVHWVPQ